MTTLHAPVSRFNPSTAASFTIDGNRTADYSPRGGFADELSPAGIELSDDAADDRNAILAEIESDRAVQSADESHAAELHTAYARAKTLAGPASVKIGRQIQIDADNGTVGVRSWWYAIIDAGAVGMATTPAAAVDEALAQLDARKSIAPAFGGFRVAGVATVQAWPHRDKADAIALSRRIAVDPAYLATALEFSLPGIIDERAIAEVVAA